MRRTVLSAGFTALLAVACRDAATPTSVAPLTATSPSDVTGPQGGAFQPDLLPLPAGTTSSSGVSINTNGDVMGSVYYATGFADIAIWVGSTPTLLPHIPLGPSPSPTDMNDRGSVIGRVSDSDPTTFGFVWQNGVYSVIPGPYPVSPLAINNSDIVVGEAGFISLPFAHAFKWDNGTFTDLHPGGVYIGSSAFDVSDAGIIVGDVLLQSGALHAAQWAPDGTFTDLGAIGSKDTWAVSVNAAGAVVGNSSNYIQPPRPFYWSPSTGFIVGPEQFQAMALSDRGRVALSKIVGVQAVRAATTRGRQPVQLLPLPSGTSTSLANDVNRCGAIAGNAYTSPRVPRAVRWTPATCD